MKVFLLPVNFESGIEKLWRSLLLQPTMLTGMPYRPQDDSLHIKGLVEKLKQLPGISRVMLNLTNLKNYNQEWE